MKTTIIILTLFATLTLTSFLRPSNRLYLSGKVYSDDKNINTQLVGLYLFVKADGKIIIGEYIDTDRHYDISFIPENQQSFDFFVTGFGIDTIFLKSYTKFESDLITWDIKLPSDYRKQFGQIICPKCSKTDQVYPIIYGKQIVQQKIVNGDTTYTNIVNKKYYTGTCIHSLLSPNWYCDRDRIKF